MMKEKVARTISLGDRPSVSGPASKTRFATASSSGRRRSGNPQPWRSRPKSPKCASCSITGSARIFNLTLDPHERRDALASAPPARLRVWRQPLLAAGANDFRQLH
jgi:hypothetical protein